MEERNVWVDYAKAFGIILVVYGHVARGVFNAGFPMDEALFQLVDSIIYSFHMPLFFFLSGLFFYDSLSRRGRAGLMFNKIDTIVYPFIVWSIIQGMSEVVLSNYTNRHVTLADVFSLLWSPSSQFWFLYALFFVFLACALIYPLFGRRGFLPLTAVFGVLYVFKDRLAVDTITLFLFGNTVFFAFGVWFNEVKAFFLAHCAALTLGFGVLFVLGQYMFHITFGLNYEVGGVPVLALAGVSICFMVTLSMWLGRLRLNALAFVGASSMSIYLMHILAGSGARVILDKFLGVDSVTVHLIVGTLMGLGGPLVAQWVIQRYGLTFFLAPPKPVSATRLRLHRADA